MAELHCSLTHVFLFRKTSGCCPVIDGSPTEFSTVYTVMENVQSMMALLTQNYSVTTFDSSFDVKAKEIQWRLRQEFECMVIQMGGFHIVMNYLAVLGKKYQSSGIADLLIESGKYESTSTSILLKGKSYNRGVRAHNIVMEALFRLQLCASCNGCLNRGAVVCMKLS